MSSLDFIRFCDPTGSAHAGFLLHGLSRLGVSEPGRHTFCHNFVYYNIFASPERCEECRELFNKAQRVRHVLTRAIHRRAIRNAELRCADDLDMSLGRLMDHPAHHRVLLHTPTPRIYYIGDLLLHWKNQIMSEEYRFPCPRKPTDPFTNVDIPEAEFMRVYCVAQTEGFRMHDVLTLLYRACGDLNKMKACGYMVLKEWALFNYVRADAHYDDLYEDLLEMRSSFAALMTNIHVSDEAPPHVRRAMVDKLRDVLIAYSAWAYGVNPAMDTANGAQFAMKLTCANQELAGTSYGRVLAVRENGIRVRKWVI